MAQSDVDELVVHLDKSMDLFTMEGGVKLVGSVLVNRNLNKWGVQNILHSAWRDWGEIEIKWVWDNTFIITIPDESVVAKILNQISGVPLYLTSEANVRHLAQEIGEFVEFEDPSKARGFLRARIIINTRNPLTTSCWLPRENNKDTWDEVVLPRALTVSMGERRVATTQENATNQVMRVDTKLSVGQLPGTDQDQNRGSIMLSYPQVGRQGRDKEKEGNGCRLERGSDQHGLELLDSPRKKVRNTTSGVEKRGRVVEHLRRMSIRSSPTEGSRGSEGRK
ncbi:hypothetical protein ACFXTI_005440 [Malus domestica]